MSTILTIISHSIQQKGASMNLLIGNMIFFSQNFTRYY